jgi:hypothetical protein
MSAVRSAASVCTDSSYREESGLQWTIIFRALHDANRCLTLMLTTVCDLRGHVTLDCKSPVSVYFPAEETLGMLFVPPVRVFPGKVRRRRFYSDTQTVKSWVCWSALHTTRT